MNDSLPFFIVSIVAIIIGIIIGGLIGSHEPIVTHTHNIDSYRYVVMCENKSIDQNPKCSYFINGKQVADPFKYEVK